MNFFQRQTESRRLSRRLVLLFTLSVVAIVMAVDVVVFSVIASSQADVPGIVLPGFEWMKANAGVVVMTTLAVVGVIALSSIYKTAALSSGGGVVARSLGGIRVSADTTDPLQRRLLNVVEEMSIAAGVPMPEVYLLEQETSINAFAAGHNPANAAIAVTRGTLISLNRSELQGVIAHEFSHILNGDMSLNIRLMGLLFGLLVIALLARTVLRFAPIGRSSRGRKGGGGAAAIMLAALAVLAIGYVGLFFGRLIQAAVSRSRESLADASAVQFTRDPAGLRGALVKIGALASGSQIKSAEAEEVAHMLFAPGVSRLFATHPPLVSRLKAIDPRFNEKEFDEVRARMSASPAAARDQDRVEDAAADSTAEKLDALIGGQAAAPLALAQLVGNPDTQHVRLAQRIRQSLPAALVIAGRHPESARALLLALALDTEPAARERQKLFVSQQLGGDVSAAMGALLESVDALEPQQRLPILTSAFAALKQLSHDERTELLGCLNAMLQREGALSLQAYVLRKLAQVQLHDDLEPRARTGHLSLSAVAGDLQVLFSVLAQHGHGDEVAARRAYEAGMQQLLPRQRPAYSMPAHWSRLLDLALSRLDRLAPVAKEQLIEALMRTIAHDAQLTVGEAELLRAVCASVHCPLPPLLGTNLPH